MEFIARWGHWLAFPAGLALASRTSVSGSAGVFQITSVAPEGLTNVGGSFQHIPSLLGVVLPTLLGRERWAGGFSLTRVNAFAQSFAGERQLDSPTIGLTHNLGGVPYLGIAAISVLGLH